MLKKLLITISFIILTGCGAGKLLNQGDVQANLEASDKIYGRCNNPNRQYTTIEKKICEGKDRAAGPDGKVGDPINITKIIDRFFTIF